MALLSDAIMRGVVGSRPASDANKAGRLYYATDEATLYRDSGSGWESVEGGGTGNVSGPGSSTDHALARWDGAGGDTLQDSAVTLSDGGVLGMADNVIERPVLKDYGETRVAANTGTSYTIDLTNGNVHELTLTGNCTFAFSNPPASGTAGSFTLILKRDATPGRTVIWPTVKWAGGAAPTLTSTANAVDILTFLTTDGGTTWYGFLAGLAFA